MSIKVQHQNVGRVIMINSNKLNIVNLEIRVPWKVLYLMRISVPDTIIKLYAVMGHGSCTKIAVL